jgi:Glycosyl transferase family 11
MFQYAFALTAAAAVGTSFWYDTSDLEPYFVLAAQRRRKPLLPPLRRREVVSDDCDDPATIIASLTDRTVYGGYFYGSGYVESASAPIRRAFTERRAVQESFGGRFGRLLASGYVCAHVRLTDFFTYRDDVTLSPDYYLRALDTLSPRLQVVFVSDDISTVRNTLSDVPAAFESNDEITDFLLLRYATAVISGNSSFSWWASWLNEEGHVIAPRYWLGVARGVEFPPGTIPARWKQISGREDGDRPWTRS